MSAPSEPDSRPDPQAAAQPQPARDTQPARRRGSGRPKGADSAARREEILATAAQVFSEDGFRATSMSTIARACGLSQTGLLHYFPTKDELLDAVMARRDQVDQAVALAPADQELRGWERLEANVELVRHNQNQPGIVRLFTTMAGEAVDRTHPANSWLVAHHRDAAGKFREAFAEADDDGHLAPDAPVEAMTRLLIAAMDGLQLQWLSDPDYAEMAPEYEVLLRTFRERWGR